jgi:uncharacterized protein YukE
MAQIIVDPADLRRFASVLEQEVRNLRERQRALEAVRRDLAQVWRDARYATFERTYLPTIQVLERFEKAAERYAGYLRSKADRADRYLGRR